MNEFIEFLQDIFMIKETRAVSVGLSQFKTKDIIETENKKESSIKTKDIKLSDLMRRL